MSIELDPINFEYDGFKYHLFTSVCEEHRNQVDFVRLVMIPSGRELSVFSRPQIETDLQRVAFEKALQQVSELE